MVVNDSDADDTQGSANAQEPGARASDEETIDYPVTTAAGAEGTNRGHQTVDGENDDLEETAVTGLRALRAAQEMMEEFGDTLYVAPGEEAAADMVHTGPATGRTAGKDRHRQEEKEFFSS